jgi:hypothetical protein
MTTKLSSADTRYKTSPRDGTFKFPVADVELSIVIPHENVALGAYVRFGDYCDMLAAGLKAVCWCRESANRAYDLARHSHESSLTPKDKTLAIPYRCAVEMVSLSFASSAEEWDAVENEFEKALLLNCGWDLWHYTYATLIPPKVRRSDCDTAEKVMNIEYARSRLEHYKNHPLEETQRVLRDEGVYARLSWEPEDEGRAGEVADGEGEASYAGESWPSPKSRKGVRVNKRTIRSVVGMLRQEGIVVSFDFVVAFLKGAGYLYIYRGKRRNVPRATERAWREGVCVFRHEASESVWLTDKGIDLIRSAFK